MGFVRRIYVDGVDVLLITREYEQLMGARHASDLTRAFARTAFR